MILAPFTSVAPLDCGLSIALGYLLFVGISGRFAPHAVPVRPTDRPSWLLGLWTGLAVVPVAIAGLRSSRAVAPDGSLPSLAPEALTLAAPIVVGLTGWLVHRGRVTRASGTPTRPRRGIVPAPDVAPPAVPSVEAPPASPRALADAAADTDARPPVATFLGIVGPERLDIPDIPVAGDEPPPDTADRPGALGEALESRVRASAAAEAKAVAAATRSVALARRAMAERAGLERKLRAAEAALAVRESTIGRLIDALERERNRTRDEAAALAGRPVPPQGRPRARREAGDAARRVEGEPTTRLARKIARARPVVSDS